MNAITPSVMLMVAMSAVAQIFGLYMLPLTKGFTQPLPTLAVAAAFVLGIGLMARVAHAGVNLSLLVPVLAAIVPIGSIAIGVLVYGEAASMAKIATLVLACVLIGIANVL